IWTMSADDRERTGNAPMTPHRSPRSIDSPTFSCAASNSSLLLIRDSLALLFLENGQSKLREVVVDLRKPVFNSLSSNLLLEAGGLAAADYALVLGMPGTGKTTTIASLIKTLISMGKTVLLTSYTHSAVDNILSKLIESKIDMLRLGNVDKVSSDLRPFKLQEATRARRYWYTAG
ncbi:hypothetical protein VP01_4502g1, partial [Puccinia sorghi]